MTPAPSCPRTIGDGPNIVPFCIDRSEWQTPEAPMRSFTSPARGASTSMSSRISSGWPTPTRTAAFTIGTSPSQSVLLGIFAFSAANRIAEEDRRGEHDAPGDERDRRRGRQPCGEVGRQRDEEQDHRREEQHVADALPEVRDAADALALLEDRIH